jgi:ornithine cyclodeaminase
MGAIELLIRHISSPIHSDRDLAMLTITAQQTDSALAFTPLLEALRETFKSGAIAPMRHHHDIVQETEDATLLLMPAWSQESGYGGIKLVNVHPDNNTKNLPSINASYLLFDFNTGQHLCLLDADLLTAKRTAAASALAASYLARADSSHLLVVGAGKVGSQLPAAFAAALPIQKVTVWDRNVENSKALVERLIEQGWDADLAPSLESAVRAADVISCATLAQQPIIKGEWLSAGQHLDLIGSFKPAMREADDQVMTRSKVFVDTQAALIESGDLVVPLASGVISNSDIQGTLYELCASEKSWRTAEDITVFKGVGHAVEDLSAACLVYQTFINEHQ